MRKHKKWLAVTLAATMTFGVCACGNNNSNGGSSNSANTENNSASNGETNSAENAAQTVAEGIQTSTDENGVITIKTQSDASFTRSTEEGTLTVGTMTNSADTMDPALSESVGPYAVFDQLFQFDSNGELVGELVESWEYLDEENTQLQLKIHEGVLFSNGEEMTVEDVLYSLDRFDEVGSSYSYFDEIDYSASYAVDDYTVVLVSPTANAALPSKMTTLRGSVVCKSWAENATDEEWWDSPVGSGPYICSENVSGSHSTFTARDDYWQGAPEFSKITVDYYTEQTTMMIDYENGKLDCFYDLNASNINRIKNGEISNSTLTLDPNTLTWTIYLPQKCSEDSPMANELFRKAFVEALDMEGLGISVADDLYKVADSMITPASHMNTTDSFEHVYDPEQAAADLEAAGYKPGEVTLTVTIEGGSGYAEIAETVQAYEAEIGINVEISESDIPTLIGRLMNCEDDFCFNKLADTIADADIYYDFNADYSTAQQVSYSDPTFNEKSKEARTTGDREERAKLYSEAWQSLYDQYYVIPCFNVYYGYVCRDYITDASMIQYNYIDVVRITSK